MNTTEHDENWAGTHRYVAARRATPSTLEELADLIRASDRARVLGTRHSFTDLADTPGTLISLRGLPSGFELDEAAATATVSSAATYADLGAWLFARGWALEALASLPHICVGGAIATGTHGSGLHAHTLSAAVRALEAIDGRGALRRIRRGDPDFDGAVVGLGALGAVTRVTLDVRRAEPYAQRVYTGLPWEAALESLDAVMGGGDSVSLFTNWVGETVAQVWVKTRGALPERDYFGATAASAPLHMIPGASPDAVTPQLGIPGAWHERLPHFRADAVPSFGAEIQTEFFVAREHGPEALRRLRTIGEELAPLLYVTELRTIASDPLWLSGASGRDALGLHFTWRREPDRVRPLVSRIEALLDDLDPRPHWGKLFTMPAERIAEVYPRLADFARLRHDWDPEGRFSNAWTRRVLGA